MDTCCYNRPFDDKSQLTVQLESNAKLFIQKEISNGGYELAWSFILDHENKFNPREEQRKNIQQWKNKASIFVKPSEEILKKSLEIESQGINKKDAMQIACAIYGKSDYFITTDYALIKKQNNEIKIINPIDFLYKMEYRK